MIVSKKKKQEVIASVELADYSSPEAYLQALYYTCKQQLKMNHEDFSETLGWARSNNQIRLIVTGKRTVSNKAAEKIAQHLSLTSLKKQYFLKITYLANAKHPTEKEEYLAEILNIRQQLNSHLIDESQLDYFCEWYNPVIREILSLTKGAASPEGIQKRLNFPLRLEQIKKSFELLVRMGIIFKDEETGLYKKASRHVATDSQIDNMLVVRYHQKMIEMGQDSIFKISENERSIEAVTLSLSKKMIPRVKHKINALMTEIINMEDENDDHDDVYQVNVQFFPFTK